MHDSGTIFSLSHRKVMLNFYYSCRLNMSTSLGDEVIQGPCMQAAVRRHAGFGKSL